jgi:hypothetical protein
MMEHWLTAGATLLSLAINALWTLANARASARIAQLFTEFKDWARAEFVSEKLCQERMRHAPGGALARDRKSVV